MCEEIYEVQFGRGVYFAEETIERRFHFYNDLDALKKNIFFILPLLTFVREKFMRFGEVVHTVVV